MTPRSIDIIRAIAQPLQPLPTNLAPRLGSWRDVRAVLCDVYGTMLISASGDVGTAWQQDRASLFGQALTAAGVAEDVDSQLGQSLLSDTIRQSHAAARARGVEYPEVDILTVWRTTLDRLGRRGGCSLSAVDHIDPRHVALTYEMFTNPTWPMPGLMACLAELHRRGLQLGIISNAQFYTRELFPALLGQTAEALGFDSALQFYSYQLGEAKPGPAIYRQACDTLARRGLSADQVVYIGNDMLNDIRPAAETGFLTVLFAGDARSLRLRVDDPRVKGVVPDAVITEWAQLPGCLEEQTSVEGSPKEG